MEPNVLEGVADLLSGPEHRQKVIDRFMLSVKPGADIFVAMVKLEEAPDRASAIEKAARAFPLPSGSKWGELALWLLDYRKNEKYFRV